MTERPPAALQQSTIAAVATGPAPGGVGVLRLSGPRALEAARRVAPALAPAPPARTALPARFEDGAGAPLDQGLVLYFPAPRSYTGEDVVELHAHGSPAVLSLLLRAVLAGPGVRLAEPGEFTQRAFLHGKLDLAQAEAVAALVAAGSEAQVRAAARQLAGGLGDALDEARAPLAALRADVEAALEYPEEVDVDPAAVASGLAGCRARLEALAARCRAGALLQRGATVVLYGPVNAGKSSLFNRLAGQERALVDPEPGTTRDALEARLAWDGLPLTLWDTAGLREGAGALEARGIARTRAALATADLAVLLLPPGASPDDEATWRAEVPPATPLLRVHGKADLAPAPPGTPAISALTGVGVEALKNTIISIVYKDSPDMAALGAERHREALERALGHLARASEALSASTLEVVAGELGLAARALGELTGEDASAELLDTLFRRFCLGK